MNRRDLLRALPAAALLAKTDLLWAAGASKGIMLMNRIAPSVSELYIANADGSNERKLLADSKFDYNAAFSADGEWLVFTSERNGDGQSDLFRVRRDGTGITPLVTEASVDDAGAISPDGTQLAFVSTRNGTRANIWVMDLKTKRVRQLTGVPGLRGEEGKPDGYFRPSWSPDGKWLAFSSDRDTPWRGHDNGHGWEHTQELAIYMIRPDGTDFRKVAAKPDFCLGSPSWSRDGKRIVFHELTTEDTWGARRPNLVDKVSSQIVSVDIATGERTEHTSGPHLKLQPQYVSATEVGYLVKGGPDEGLAYTSGRKVPMRWLRSPSWSADGKFVVYEKVAFRPLRPENKHLYSWDKEWEYRHSDVFPTLSRDGTLAITEKGAQANLVTMKPDGSDRKTVFDVTGKVDPKWKGTGLTGAFQPAWSPDSQWIAFGLGAWFFIRDTGKATIMRVRRDGSGAEALTDGTVHSGFPSYSADGNEIVFRVWGDQQKGLRILDLTTRKVRVLTSEYDNLPGWSPDGKLIVFTRNTGGANYDIFTIRPDGTDLRRVTTHPSGDGHAVWTADGKIMWSASQHGFRDEAALYDQTFQQYGQIYIMNADGSNKRMLTDSRWEDSMPLYLPRKLFGAKVPPAGSR